MSTVVSHVCDDWTFCSTYLILVVYTTPSTRLLGSTAAIRLCSPKKGLYPPAPCVANEIRSSVHAFITLSCDLVIRVGVAGSPTVITS